MYKLQPETSDFLDSMRGFAAIIVFLAHINQVFILPLYGLGGITQKVPGYLASCSVQIFMILSGFVISMSLYNSCKREEHWFLNFILKRIARIYPPLLFSCALTLLVMIFIKMTGMHGADTYRLPSDLYVVREFVEIKLEQYIYTILMLPALFKSFSSVYMNGPLWSISYEFWMYIIASFIVLLGRKSILKAAVAILFLNLMLWVFSNNRFLFLGSLWFLGSFIFLCCISANKDTFHLLLNYQSFTTESNDTSIVRELMVRRKKCSILRGFGNLIKKIFFKKQFYSVCLISIFLFFVREHAYLFQIILMTCLSYGVIYFKSWSFSFFRGFKFFAKFSYTLYVIHFPLLLIFFSLFHNTFTQSGWGLRFIIILFVFFCINLMALLLAKKLESSSHFYYYLKSILNGFTELNQLFYGFLEKNK